MASRVVYPHHEHKNADYSNFDNTTWNTTVPVSNEIPPAGTNQYALYDGIGNSINVSALLPETQYCFSIFEYQGLHCYNLTPLTKCVYSVSNEPTVNSNSLTANVVSATQINLNFQSMLDAGLPATNHGYIILQKTGAIPTEIPADGANYTVGNVIGGAKVAAIITNPNAITTAINGLTSSTQYCFTIYSYRWNGSNLETYNYYTPALVPSTCGLLLPVELISFNGYCSSENNIILRWTTASEQNSDSFYVEKSIDGFNFYTIGTVAAAGNSNSIKNYSFIDNAATTSINYYRLTEKDTDNKSSKSKVIQIKCNATETINSYYDANTNEVVIDVNTNFNKELAISITDILGRLIKQEIRKVDNGFTKLIINIDESLGDGVFIIYINDGINVYTKKVSLKNVR